MPNFLYFKKMSLEEKFEIRYKRIDDWYKNGKKLSITDLAKKLLISRQYLYKLIKLYEEGKLKYKSRISNNKIKESVKDKVVAKYKNWLIYLNENVTRLQFYPTLKRCYERLNIKEDNKISYTSFINILKEKNFFAKSSHRKTKRMIRKRIKQEKLATNRTKDTLVEDALKDQEKNKHIPILRKKKGVFGQVIEIDACQHDWFINGKMYHVYAIIDSATGMLLNIHMEEEETAIGYWKLLIYSFLKWGVPLIIKCDKRKCFWNGIEANSCIARMCKYLGVQFQASSNPMSKPNVERSFKNMQQFFVCYFREHNITSCEEVNENKQFYINLYNKEYNKKPTETNAFSILEKDIIIKNMKFEVTRKVLKGNYLALNNEKYVPVNEENKRVLMPEYGEMKILYSPIEGYHIYLKNKKFALKTLSDAEYDESMANYHKEKNLAFETRKARSFQKNLSKQIQKLENQNKYLLKKLKELNL